MYQKAGNVEAEASLMERAQDLIFLEPGIILDQERVGNMTSLVLWLDVLGSWCL